MTPIRVLFICSGNSCRSQMAEAFLRRYGQGLFEVQSAGTRPVPVDEGTIEVMARAGIDISNQRPRSVTEFVGREFDFIITVCDAARDASPRFDHAARLIHWRFADPALVEGTPFERRKALLRVRDEIAARVRLFAYAQSRRVESRARELARLAAAPAVAASV